MGLERAQVALLAALAATIPVSIFAAETLFALALLVFVARLRTGGARLEGTPLDAPLLAFAVWTLLSASFARDPALSHEDAKKLLLFVLFYLAAEALSRGEARERVLSALFLGGLALATLMVVQHSFLGYDTLAERPKGFLGHWMTASGVVMGVVVAAAARLVFDRGGRPRPRDAWLAALALAGVGLVAALEAAGAGVLPRRLFVAVLAAGAAAVALARWDAVRRAERALPWLVVPVGSWAIVVSQTRNAWLGALAGLSVVAVTRRPRLLLGVAALVAAVAVARPAVVTSRLTVHDVSSIDRYYLWQAGLDMVLDRPVFGQGPGMILGAYPRYRWPEAPNPTTPHLHDNLLQLAAERGLPGLAFFLWWVVIALAVALHEARRAGEPPPGGWSAVAALGGLAAVMVAGLFEYNLGDSEVLMLALLLMSLPFARRRERSLGPS
jgi:O-antigen ligase